MHGTREPATRPHSTVAVAAAASVRTDVTGPDPPGEKAGNGKWPWRCSRGPERTPSLQVCLRAVTASLLPYVQFLGRQEAEEDKAEPGSPSQPAPRETLGRGGGGRPGPVPPETLRWGTA